MFCVKLHYIIVTSPSQMGGPTIEALLGIILRGFAFIKFQALLVEFLSHLMSLSYLKLFWWYPEFYHIWNPTIEALLWIIPWGICLYQTWSSFSAISITFDAFIILEAFLVVVWVLSHLKHHNWGAFGDYSLGNCFYQTFGSFGSSLGSIIFDAPQLKLF